MQKNALNTNLVLRGAFLAAGISIFLLLAFLFLHHSPPPPAKIESTVAEKTPVPLAVSVAMSGNAQAMAIPAPPSVAAAENIPPCLSAWKLEQMPKDLNGMRDILWEKMGPPEKEALQWRNIHFTEAGGTKRRLRVALEATADGRARYEMRLFSVDEEDLPVPLQITDRERFSPTRDIVQKYLQGSEVTFDSSKTEYLYLDGSSLELESENGKIKLLHLRGKDFSVGCETNSTTQAADCACIK